MLFVLISFYSMEAWEFINFLGVRLVTIPALWAGTGFR